MKYAIDIYKETGKVELNINRECYNEVAFSEALEEFDNCDDCEFCVEDNVGIIGGMVGMSAGTRKRCEKGYWKEDV